MADGPTDEELAAMFARTDEVAAAAEQRRLEESRHFVLYEHMDWRYDSQQEKYWDVRHGILCTEKTVDSFVPRDLWRWDDPPPRPEGARGPAPQPRRIPASRDIREPARGMVVYGATWWPGKPPIIENTFIDGAGPHGWSGRHTYNVYRAGPVLGGWEKGDPKPWITHLQRMFPEKTEQEWLINYCAHMVQRPWEKPAGGVVLSGSQGTGKDALLLPVKAAVGYNNVRNVQPDELFNKFNGFVQSVMLVVDEARSQSDEHKATSMYNILKPLAVAPPDWVQVDAKYKKPYYVPNCCRLFITTNEVEGLFIPQDDRRLGILHTETTREEELPRLREYWNWVRQPENLAAVQHWLLEHDISNWDCNAEPPKSHKHREVQASWDYADDDPLVTLLHELNHPEVLFIKQIKDLAARKLDWEDYVRRELSPRKMARTMRKLGYLPVQPLDHRAWFSEAGNRRFRIKIGWRREDVPREKAIPALNKLFVRVINSADGG